MKNKSFIALAFVLPALISCNFSGNNASDNNHSSSVNSTIQIAGTGIEKLLNSQVCMVNNRFMGKDQIPVAVNDKTYYGCCEGCVSKLKNGTDLRYSSDLLTGEKVDKALAVIIVKPGTKDEVLYFKSETNAKKYIEKQAKK